MANKIPSILLIDDDIATTTYNEVIIEDSECVDQVVSKNSGEEALEYLSGVIGNSQSVPSIIFLDINMPTMDGWEFLESYLQLDIPNSTPSKIFLLSSSSDEEEEERMKHNPILEGIKHKPLTIEMIQEIATNYF